MRLDHIAYRVKSRDKAVDFFMKAFGYKFQAEFEIFFNDEKTDKALCIALEPPEKTLSIAEFASHTIYTEFPEEPTVEMHLAPEIFVSEGTEGSIVGNWVKARGNIGGIHHLAYMVNSVEKKKKEWLEKGWGDFSSEKAFKCEDLTQIFSKPHELTGVIYEFIERHVHSDGHSRGFCKDNVKQLMMSTADKDIMQKVALDKNIKG